VGARRTAGQNFEFGLSGQSDGYIGCTLSPDNALVNNPDNRTGKLKSTNICNIANVLSVCWFSSQGGGDTTYVCANNNGRVEFIGTILQNGRLIRQTVSLSSFGT
jgi:hypothetical protein